MRMKKSLHLEAIHSIQGNCWYSFTYFHLFPVSYYCEGTRAISKIGRPGIGGHCPKIRKGISFQKFCYIFGRSLFVSNSVPLKSVQLLLF